MLLSEHRYAEVAEFVHILERDQAAAGDLAAAGLLSAARELCLACGEQHAELEARRRTEQRLRRRLAAVLGMASGADETAPPAPVDAGSPAGEGSPSGAGPRNAALTVYCLGPLQVYRGDRLLEPWPSRRAKSVFKYLVTHQRPVPKELLMDQFWPEAQANSARNNLNVAIHGLRRFLRAGDDGPSPVLFREDCYRMNPELVLWVDIDEFERHLAAVRGGGAAKRADALEAAEAVYRGPLFEDEPYEDWSARLRRRLQGAYLEILEHLRDHHFAARDYVACAAVARKILAVEPAHEKTHQALMLCYARQGQHYLAQRQYHECVDELRSNLDVPPSEWVRRLYSRIRGREPV